MVTRVLQSILTVPLMSERRFAWDGNSYTEHEVHKWYGNRYRTTWNDMSRNGATEHGRQLKDFPIGLWRRALGAVVLGIILTCDTFEYFCYYCNDYCHLAMTCRVAHRYPITFRLQRMAWEYDSLAEARLNLLIGAMDEGSPTSAYAPELCITCQHEETQAGLLQCASCYASD
jgi:hypothetical protein